MKIIKIIATTSALCAFATTAAAQDGKAYGNLGVELLDVQGTSWNAVGRVGYDLHEYFAVEGISNLIIKSQDLSVANTRSVNNLKSLRVLGISMLIPTLAMLMISHLGAVSNISSTQRKDTLSG